MNKKAILEIIGEQSVKIKLLETENREQAARIAFLERENSELRLATVTLTGRPTRELKRLTVEDLVGPDELSFDVKEDDDNSSIPSLALVSDNSDDSSMPSLIDVDSNVLEKPPLLRMRNDPNDPYGLYNNSESVLPEIPEPAEDLLASLDKHMIDQAQTRYYDQIDMEIERQYYADKEAIQGQAKANDEDVTEEKDGWLYYLKRQRVY